MTGEKILTVALDGDMGEGPVQAHSADGGYRLSGSLQIHGQTRDCVVELGVEDLGDEWSVSCEQQVRQTDFGVKPYSLAMGTLKVADVVTVSFTGRYPK